MNGIKTKGTLNVDPLCAYTVVIPYRLFTRLVLEAPKITPTVMDIIKSYCCSEVRKYMLLQ